MTLKFVGSLNTVRMPSAWACMSTSWISPGSRESSSTVVEATWSAKAAESAALEAWRAAPVKVEAIDDETCNDVG